MKWSKEAEEAVSRVPFFVRKRVKKKVEEEAARCGDGHVTLEHVRASQKRFLNNMEDEVKGYQVESCFGPSGCPNRAVADDELARELVETLESCNLREFLRKRVEGPLRMHHEFRVSVSDCPNACSRPQIVDVGLIGAIRPHTSDDPCSRCGSCVEICKENAISLPEESGPPIFNLDSCVNCCQCIRVCPAGALQEHERGYRILLGGKLGRHPQLGIELPGIFSKDQAIRVVDICVQYFQKHNRKGERFGEIINRIGVAPLKESIDRQIKNASD